jgi:hypothetical protein
VVKDKAYPIQLDLAESLPEELDRGARFFLVLALVTKSGCDLSGATFQVSQGAEAMCAGVLPGIIRRNLEAEDYDPRNGPIDLRDTARIALAAPREIGAFQWALTIPAQEIGGIAHAKASLIFSFRTAAHKTSLVTWDVPSTVVTGERFMLKAGAKCTAGCALNGRQLELRNDQGGVLAVATLGETPWADAEGLYLTEFEVTAPAEEGLCHWSIALGASEPHLGASAALSFATVMPACHDVTIMIVERDTATPIGDAQVRLGFYRTTTDQAGISRVRVPPGKHRLFVWKAGYAVSERIVEVEQNLDLFLEAEALPKVDPYARWEG